MKAGYIFSFIAGAAVGVFAGFKLSETKYQAKIQEEIASVKEAFRNRKVDISKFAPKESKKVDDFLDEVSKKYSKTRARSAESTILDDVQRVLQAERRGARHR